MAWKYNKYSKPIVPVNVSGRTDKTATVLAVFLIIAAILIGIGFLYIFISDLTFFSYSKAGSGFGSGGGGGNSSGYVPSTPAETPVSASTTVPTTIPTAAPTAIPTADPTAIPTTVPTSVPSLAPTAEPNVTAGDNPTDVSDADPGVDERRMANNQAEQVPKKPLYVRHRNDEYGFSCLFPKHFVVYKTDNDSPPYIARSPKGMAKEIMDAKSAYGCNIESELDSYIDLVGGEITYVNTGEDFYAVSMTAGDTCYYKYCKLANGNIYSFEFINPLRQDSVYSEYIETIYQGFTID